MNPDTVMSSIGRLERFLKLKELDIVYGGIVVIQSFPWKTRQRGKCVINIPREIWNLDDQGRWRTRYSVQKSDINEIHA